MKKEFWMKRGISVVLSALLLSTMSAVPSMAAEQVYTDVPADSWYYEAALYTAGKGAVQRNGKRSVQSGQDDDPGHVCDSPGPYGRRR